MSVVTALITNSKTLLFNKEEEEEEKNDVHDARLVIFGNMIPKEKQASKINTATNFSSFRLNKKKE